MASVVNIAQQTPCFFYVYDILNLKDTLCAKLLKYFLKLIKKQPINDLFYVKIQLLIKKIRVADF